MKVQIDCVSYNIQFDRSSTGLIPIVFLHGFMGSSKDWQFLTGKLNEEFNPIFIDLVGHGSTDSPGDKKHYTEDSIITSLKSIFDKLNLHEFIMAGYSMGGRAALCYSLKYPAQTKGLILEGANPGIKEKNERKKRAKNDYQMSLMLENEQLENFLQYWYSQAIFKSLKKSEIKKLILLRKTNNKFGLAKVLRNFSTGKMKNHWNELDNIKCKTLLIAGEFDKKYCEINKKISGKIKSCQLEMIKKAGHNTHLENHFEYISVVNNFLTNYF